jgi:hypothetical protein
MEEFLGSTLQVNALRVDPPSLVLLPLPHTIWTLACFKGSLIIQVAMGKLTLGRRRGKRSGRERNRKIKAKTSWRQESKLAS